MKTKLKLLIYVFIESLCLFSICFGQGQGDVWERNPEYEILEDGSIFIGGTVSTFTPEEREEYDRYWNDVTGNQYSDNQGSLSQKVTTPHFQQMDIDQFFQLYSLNMRNRGYSMSPDDCQLKYQDIIGNYFECKVTNDVKLTIFFDDNMMTTAIDVLGWHKKYGALNKETDIAFRAAYSCFFSDTRETTYQDWIENIQIGMEMDKVYTINGISAIWGEGLYKSNSVRDGQYYYKITFFLTDAYLQ